MTWWSAWSPWLKFIRATFIPASSRASMRSSDAVAGPMVQTIFARRVMVGLSCGGRWWRTREVEPTWRYGAASQDEDGRWLEFCLWSSRLRAVGYAALGVFGFSRRRADGAVGIAGIPRRAGMPVRLRSVRPTPRRVRGPAAR